MSTQNDLLNGNNNKKENLASEELEHTKMCSNWQDNSDSKGEENQDGKF
ncbi:MAG TPA: hypothetical protein VJZ04_05770 [Lachnospiraceae bacterium]|nr:hypothetical protein [Lachnospiraceae bacterium]